MMYTAQLEGMGTFVIRYPRGRGVNPDWKVPFQQLKIGKGQTLRDGKDIAIITIGHVGNTAIEVCNQLATEGIDAAHYDMRFLKPIDKDLLHTIFAKHKRVITIEDGTILGGLGSAVMEFAADNNYHAKIKRLGIPDRFVEQGTLDELKAECGFDKTGIIKAIKDILYNKST